MLNQLKEKYQKYSKLSFMSIFFAAVSLLSVTFAWFAYSNIVDNDLKVQIKSWNIDITQNNTSISNQIGVEIPDFYPGSEPFNRTIMINNLGDIGANISYKIKYLRIFDTVYELDNQDELFNKVESVKEKMMNDASFELNEKLSYDDCVKLGRYLHTEFLSGKYKTVKILYTKYINSLRFEPTLKTLFPIERKENKSNIGYAPIYDPNVKTLIEELIPISLISTIYQSLIESQVSEQASRRTAMENANDNAQEIIDKLTLEFNKVRQAAITQEITEVVASQGK